MGFDRQHRQFDEALDRIERGILPGIGALLEGLLRAAEAGGSADGAHRTELAAIARQIEALTDAMSRAPPSEEQRSDAA